MKSDTYILIQGWMRSELDLKGNDLLVYAIIYGFSQDRESRFTGSLQYLADWCGATKQGIMKNLTNLLEKGLIKKTETYKNNIKLVSYYTTELHTPIQLSCMDNIDNNIDNNIIPILSKDNIDDYSGVGQCSESVSESKQYTSEDYKDEFLGSAKRRKKPEKKNSLFSKCSQEIMTYCISKKDMALVETLQAYLQLRWSMKDKPIYAVSQWQALLNKLDEVSNQTGASREDIVSASIEHGWASFYPPKSYEKNKQSTFSEYGDVSCKKANPEDIVDDEY